MKPTSPGQEGKAVPPPSIPWGFLGSFIHSIINPLQTEFLNQTPLPKIHRWLPITSRIETHLVL